MHRFLAFDLGAESGRAMVATLQAGRVTLQEAHRFPTHSGKIQGTLHWNLLAIWEEIRRGLESAGKTGRLDGIGVDTWGVDYGLLDAAGRILGNPVCYRDSRTHGVMEELFAQVPKERVFAATGTQFMFINTLVQLYAASRRQGWAQELRDARRLLFIPDLLHYLLSGVAVNELTIASTSQMLNPATQSWAVSLLEELRLPTHLLGEIVPPGAVVGKLLPEVAADAGLPIGIPVIAPGSHDTASAVAAVPVADDPGGWCYISSGTWSLMGVEIDSPVIDDRALRLNYTNELGVGGKVRLLRNIMGLWLVQEVRRDLRRQGTDLDYAALMDLARDAKPLQTLLDTWHPPFALPGDMLGKIRGYAQSTRQPVPETPGQFVRCCLDSLALSYRAVAERLEQLTGRSLATIHIVGGGTQNKLLNQLTADACGRRVIAGPVEATALGNALTQAMGAGAVSSLAQARRIIADSFSLETYAPRDTAGFDAVYGRFLQLSGL